MARRHRRNEVEQEAFTKRLGFAIAVILVVVLVAGVVLIVRGLF